MKIINAIRIWPPPRWPLVHKAIKVFTKEGKEGFISWKNGLSVLERSDFANQVYDLFRSAIDKKLEDILGDLGEGKE